MVIFNKFITFSYKFIALYLFVHRISATDLIIGDSCTLPNGTTGICKSIETCRGLIDQIASRRMSVGDLSKLRCGFEGVKEIVCCGDTLSGITKKRKSEEACVLYRQHRKPPLDFRIFGEQMTSLGFLPHMAALGYLSAENKQPFEFKCSGSLISERYILTAAHCADKQHPQIVRLGTISINNLGHPDFYGSKLDVDVESVILHPEYLSTSHYHDLALIRLAKVVPFNLDLHPACLNTELSDDNLSSAELIVSGWGSLSTDRAGEKEPPILIKTTFVIINSTECNIKTRFLRSAKLSSGITSGQLCAIDAKDLSGTICESFIGGPIQMLDDPDGQQMPIIIGLHSFGKVCEKTVPGIYSRVAFYLYWIESIVWPN